jgi:hypothetical protein
MNWKAFGKSSRASFNVLPRYSHRGTEENHEPLRQDSLSSGVALCAHPTGIKIIELRLIVGYYVRNQGSKGTQPMKTDFRDTVLCSLVEVVRRFGGAYCFHQQGDRPVIFRFRAVIRIDSWSTYCSFLRHFGFSNI